MSDKASGRRFQKVKQIGEGTYGTVTKVYDNKLKIYIAVKKLKFHEDQDTIPIHALRQILSLKQLCHPNIVTQNIEQPSINHISYELKKRKLYIGFEYLQQTLDQYLKNNGPLSPYSIKFLLFEILNALEYLQSNGYMHRDLKPQNIMFTADNTLKLIDFGQTKRFTIQNLCQQRHSLQVSTLWYKAPELLLGFQFYSNKIQIWSLGCIFAQIATGKPLFDSLSEIEQIFKIFQLLGTPRLQGQKQIVQWPYFFASMPKFRANKFEIPMLGQDGNDLLRKMLTINPSNRISISQALQHPFFAGFY